MTKKHRKHSRLILLLALIAAVAISALALATKPCVDHKTELYIPTGTSYSQLLDLLGEAEMSRLGVVDFVGRLKKLDRAPKPGHYIFEQGATPITVVNMLRSGAQKPVRLTFNNVRTLPQLAGRIAEQLEVDSLTLLHHLEAPATAEKYDITPEQIIGLFIPNTYEIWWNSSPEALTDRMEREWERFWNDKRTDALARTKLSKMEVITLASIVYEETKQTSEMPKIAGVYINRLRRGMPLQACPTAKYAVGDFSLKRILHKHTRVESPYNTYINRGLPPGPICTPSIAAIDAVLNYTSHNYLYFCAKEDLSGTHNFSTNLSQHNRYAQRYAEAIRKAGIR